MTNPSRRPASAAPWWWAAAWAQRRWKTCWLVGKPPRFGHRAVEFKEKIAKISELAVGDACTGSNPRAIDPAAMEKLFTCTYYGTEVDF